MALRPLINHVKTKIKHLYIVFTDFQNANDKVPKRKVINGCKI